MRLLDLVMTVLCLCMCVFIVIVLCLCVSMFGVCVCNYLSVYGLFYLWQQAHMLAIQESVNKNNGSCYRVILQLHCCKLFVPV